MSRPKNSPPGPHKAYDDPSRSKTKATFEGSLETKVFQFVEYTPKQFLKTTPAIKQPIRAPNIQNDPKTKTKLYARIKGNMEDKSCCTI